MLLTGARLMATKKTKTTGPKSAKERDAGPGRKPKPAEERKSAVMQIRCSEEWRGWMAEFAKFLGMDKAAVIDAAMTGFAHARGFRPPPRR
jgi:hypothetical protein